LDLNWLHQRLVLVSCFNLMEEDYISEMRFASFCFFSISASSMLILDALTDNTVDSDTTETELT